MRPPPWLTELHRQWQKARGKRPRQSTRPFTRDWHKLLESSGTTTGEDIATAERELISLAQQGHLTINYYQRRIIQKIALPPESEPWLRDLFGTIPATDLAKNSHAILTEFLETPHPVFPEAWSNLIGFLHTEFTATRSPHPFKWTEPEALRESLAICLALTSREWEPGTLIRSASVAIGLDSKGLEKRQKTIESALSRLFNEEFKLKSLGLAEGDTHVELSGRFRLHFPDGTHQEIDNLRIAKIDTSDIFRCTSITTEAEELLTIENRKTTFRQYAVANRDSLIATTSFPTPTFREFLKKLPPEITHRHFGDTDPAGWHILLKLREATGRPVEAFQMKWRPAKTPNPLTAYDRKTLPKLLSSELLTDVREQIQAILANDDKGDYEQETIGPVDLGEEV